ncbi:MAG: DUF559 domain-containing protein [Solirubrobacterales bacterium]
MARKSVQAWAPAVWRLARRQHGVVARAQLLELGLSRTAIEHRLKTGRLHRLHRGVFAVGRPRVGRLGELHAAVLACGPAARLSHRSGAELWGIRRRTPGPVEVSAPASANPRCPGVKVYRRAGLRAPREVASVPVNDPVSILVDLATCLSTEAVEAAVNEADRLGLVSTDRLPTLLEALPRRPGRGRLRAILAAQTFSRSQSALERRFLPIARAAGLPRPRAQSQIGAYRVDFHWPHLGLVVEADSLAYHRTAADQAVDMRRDQAHARRGLRTLRFTHSQIFHQPRYVQTVLEEAARHLG